MIICSGLALSWDRVVTDDSIVPLIAENPGNECSLFFLLCSCYLYLLLQNRFHKLFSFTSSMGYLLICACKPSQIPRLGVLINQHNCLRRIFLDTRRSSGDHCTESLYWSYPNEYDCSLTIACSLFLASLGKFGMDNKFPDLRNGITKA